MGMHIVGEDVVLYYMERDKICTKIVVKNGTVHFENYVDLFARKAFGSATSATLDDFEEFLETRCFPKTRANCKELLRMLDVDFYEPYLIVLKTHGVMCHDDFWIKFEGEEITFREAKIRMGLPVHE